MAYVYPRLPRSVALQTWEMRVEEFVASGESPATLSGDSGIDPLATFDPTGMRVTPEILAKLRDDILEAACESGFPLPANPDAYRKFEMKVGRILLETAELMPGEGGQPDIWSHMALILLPDVAFWRWPDPDAKRKARFVGGIRQLRNVFEVCWFRAMVLDDPSNAEDRLHLMAPLTQDALVNIVERASLARCRPLARSLARAFPEVSSDSGSLPLEQAFRQLCARMTLVGAVVNFDVLEESEIFELVLQQLEIVRGTSQPALDARESSSPLSSSGPAKPVPLVLPEIRSEDSRSESGEEMEATAATTVAEQSRSNFGEAGVVLAPSGYEGHRFWGPFYNAGVLEFPEIEKTTPTGALPDKDEKIAPYICSGYQVDIRYARSGNSCRLLSLECIDNNYDFERKVGGHVKWNSGGTVTVEAAPRQEQKNWSMKRRVTETLGVYRKIKDFVLNKVILSKETEYDPGQKSESKKIQRQTRDRASTLLDQSVPHYLEEDFTYKRPVGFKIGDLYFLEANTWSLILEKLCMHLFSLDPAKYLETPDNNNLLSSRGTKYFSRVPADLRKPREFCGGVFVETNISANAIRDNIKKLLQVFGVPGRSFEIFLQEDRDASVI